MILYVAVLFGSVFAGFKAFPWPTIFVFAAIWTFLGVCHAIAGGRKMNAFSPLVAMALNSVIASVLYGIGHLTSLVI